MILISLENKEKERTKIEAYPDVSCPGEFAVVQVGLTKGSVYTTSTGLPGLKSRLLELVIKSKVDGLTIKSINEKIWRGGTPAQAVAFALGSQFELGVGGSSLTLPPKDKFEKSDVQVTFDEGNACPIW
jgi:hypothetical protein